MMLRFTALLLIILGLPPLSSAEPVRIAVVIGHNRGGSSMRPLKFAQSDAKRLSRLLTELGGFRPANVRLLAGSDAGRVKRELARLNSVVQQHKKLKRRVFLLIYYSGHADGLNLNLGRSKLPYAWLRIYLEQSPADMRLALIDACHSGTLIRKKGLRRGPSFRLRLDHRLKTAGLAILTSSSPNEYSQESERIGGSYFTHFLISGLRGDAELNRDGRVTLGELYAYVYHRTVSRTSKTMVGIQHPSYYLKLSGSGELVLTRLRPLRHLVLPKEQAGTFLIIHKQRSQVMAEVRKPHGVERRIALEPGTYLVRRIQRGRVTEARVVLVRSDDRLLASNDFKPVVLRSMRLKGGLAGLQHGLRMMARLTNGMLNNQSGLYSGVLEYDIAFGDWSIGPTFGFLRKPIRDGALRYDFTRVAFSVGAAWRALSWRWVRLYPGLQLGGLYSRQDFDKPLTRSSWGLQAAFNLRLEFRPYRGLTISLRPEVGLTAFRQDGRMRPRLQVGGAIGVGYWFNE